jgi:phosphatidylinositol alpha-1,6-mannosyltransferase
VDLVHSMEAFPAGWVGDALARRLGVPHVASACGTYAVLWRRDPILAIPYRRVLRRAAGVYPISHGTEAKMRAAFAPGPAPAGLRTVVIGTDAAARIPRETAWNRRPPADPLVLSVGGVKPRKGYSVSLRAFGLLQKKFPAARYVVVGRHPPGAYRRSLEESIASETIRNVEFLDVVDDARLDALYRKASMFLLLSREEGDRFEGFGMVYLEAGAYGLPVLGGNTGGIPDAVTDGETGFLLNPDDAPAAAEAMARLASDAELARRMGRAGRAKAEAMTWERYAREQFQAYPPALLP